LGEIELLRTLNLHDNQITEIENIGHMRFLQEITLERNNWKTQDFPFIGKPAKEIVEYCKKKAEKIKKNIAFKQKVKGERDQFQIAQELAAETVIQTPGITKKVREDRVQITDTQHLAEQENPFAEVAKLPQPQLELQNGATKRTTNGATGGIKAWAQRVTLPKFKSPEQ